MFQGFGEAGHRRHVKRPLDGHYWLDLILCNISFCSWADDEYTCDTDAAYVAIAIAFYIKRKMKIRRWTKDWWYKRRSQYTDRNRITALRLGEPNDYKIFCCWVDHHGADRACYAYYR
jgi:hypothetical protein